MIYMMIIQDVNDLYDDHPVNDLNVDHPGSRLCVTTRPDPGYK